MYACESLHNNKYIYHNGGYPKVVEGGAREIKAAERIKNSKQDEGLLGECRIKERKEGRNGRI